VAFHHVSLNVCADLLERRVWTALERENMASSANSIVPLAAKTTASTYLAYLSPQAINRKDFSHCNANVKSPLDEVLRRGSVSVKPQWERWLVGFGAEVPVT